MKVGSETRFSITPEWVLYAAVSDGAKVLYGFLARIADIEGDGYVTKGQLAERMGKSPRQVVRLVRELQAIGALVTSPRFGPDGGQRGNAFELRVTQPSGGGDTSAMGRDVVPATPKEESPSERKPISTAEPSKEHARDEYFENVVTVCGYGPEALTDSLRIRIGKFGREVRELDTPPSFILGFERIWREAHPEIPITIGVLANNWGNYMAGSVRPLPRAQR